MDGPIEMLMEIIRLQGELFALAVRRYGHRMLWVGAVLFALLLIVFSCHAVFWACFLFFLPGHFILASLAMLGLDFLVFCLCLFFATRIRKPSRAQKSVQLEREEKIQEFRESLAVSSLISFMNSPLGKTAVLWGLNWIAGYFFKGKKNTYQEDLRQKREEERRKRMDFSRKGRGWFWRIF